MPPAAFWRSRWTENWLCEDTRAALGAECDWTRVCRLGLGMLVARWVSPHTCTLQRGPLPGPRCPTLRPPFCLAAAVGLLGLRPGDPPLATGLHALPGWLPSCVHRTFVSLARQGLAPDEVRPSNLPAPFHLGLGLLGARRDPWAQCLQCPYVRVTVSLHCLYPQGPPHRVWDAPSWVLLSYKRQPEAPRGASRPHPTTGPVLEVPSAGWYR